MAKEAAKIHLIISNASAGIRAQTLCKTQRPNAGIQGTRVISQVGCERCRAILQKMGMGRTSKPS